jgi:hypothetical protein
MILQAAALAALFVDQTSTNQLVLQCMQKVEPESLGEMVTANDCADNSQLVSIAAGVLIAWRSFRATSERDHHKWILDQKKCEWKECLKSVGEVERLIPIVWSSLEKYEKLDPAVTDVLSTIRSQLSIHSTLKKRELIQEWQDFVVLVTVQFRVAVDTYFSLQGQSEASLDGFEAIRRQKSELESNVRSKFLRIHRTSALGSTRGHQ